MNPSIVIRCSYQRGPEGELATEDTYGQLPMRAAVRIRISNFSRPFGAWNRIPLARALIKPLQKSFSRCAEVFHKCLSLFVYGNHPRRKDQQGVAENLQEVAEKRQGNE